jgi:hypothetical protein
MKFVSEFKNDEKGIHRIRERLKLKLPVPLEILAAYVAGSVQVELHVGIKLKTLRYLLYFIVSFVPETLPVLIWSVGSVWFQCEIGSSSGSETRSSSGSDNRYVLFNKIRSTVAS